MLKPSGGCFCGDASEQQQHTRARARAHTSSQVGAEDLLLLRGWSKPHRSRSTFHPDCFTLNATRKVVLITEYV